MVTSTTKKNISHSSVCAACFQNSKTAKRMEKCWGYCVLIASVSWIQWSTSAPRESVSLALPLQSNTDVFALLKLWLHVSMSVLYVCGYACVSTRACFSFFYGIDFRMDFSMFPSKLFGYFTESAHVLHKLYIFIGFQWHNHDNNHIPIILTHNMTFNLQVHISL